MAVAHDALMARLGLQIGMLCQKIGDLRFNRPRLAGRPRL
jgi:hypothetical protein